MEIKTGKKNIPKFQNTEEVYDMSELEIRKLESIVPHLAVENTFCSTLIDDIAYVDYTEDSKGMTCLQELDGLPPFIDDLYAFLYIYPRGGSRISLAGVRLGQSQLFGHGPKAQISRQGIGSPSF